MYPHQMAKETEPPREISDLLAEELRRRGLTDEQIAAATRKRKRRQQLELAAVRVPLYGRTPTARAGGPDELCTVEFAAGQLKLHPKTILRFIKEGRLRATRIGKAYRIQRADLDAFGGLAATPETPSTAPAVAAPLAASVTSIVDIPGVGSDVAQKWARQIPAALAGQQGRAGAMRAEVIHDPDRAHLKIVLVGSPGDTAGMLSLIRLWLDQSEG